MIFEILFSVFLVHLSISLSTESSITCLNKEKFSTPSGDLDCQLSCQCPSDDQKEVRSVYVGCEKCCCVDMNYKRIEKALQETTERLNSTLHINQKLIKYNANLKKKSEETVNQLENKVSALIIAICLASFVLLVIIGATIFIFLFKNWLKQFDIPYASQM
ncbi:uncharacterized protein LOC101235027 isoform X2 [Hydra vulgaris]|uniref:uncharacterized protein LOC101235027 isoform X2 n=1 Tax=Hydra vulgaris TaxID=6087 RepID=UPI0006410110|nr:uncharacterized protein LOC101235027 isoform X2 [Hydra vulgaris]